MTQVTFLQPALNVLLCAHLLWRNYSVIHLLCIAQMMQRNVALKWLFQSMTSVFRCKMLCLLVSRAWIQLLRAMSDTSSTTEVLCFLNFDVSYFCVGYRFICCVPENEPATRGSKFVRF